MIHRLAAHYLAAIRSSSLGRSSSASAVLVMASLLELAELLLFGAAHEGSDGRVSQLSRAMHDMSHGTVLWSLQPWEKPEGRPASFADLTAWLPMVSPAACHLARDKA